MCDKNNETHTVAMSNCLSQEDKRSTRAPLRSGLATPTANTGSFFLLNYTKNTKQQTKKYSLHLSVRYKYKYRRAVLFLAVLLIHLLQIECLERQEVREEERSYCRSRIRNEMIVGESLSIRHFAERSKASVCLSVCLSACWRPGRFDHHNRVCLEGERERREKWQLWMVC